MKELLQRAHDLLDQANADNGGEHCNYCHGGGLDGDGIRHDSDCIIVEMRAILNPPAPKHVLKDVYNDNELRYAAFDRCLCGAGMAYPLAADAYGPTAHWDCSDILTGRAVPHGQPGSVKHEAKLPFMFYEIKSEDQPSTGGATTRQKATR